MSKKAKISVTKYMNGPLAAPNVQSYSKELYIEKKILGTEMAGSNNG